MLDKVCISKLYSNSMNETLGWFEWFCNASAPPQACGRKGFSSSLFRKMAQDLSHEKGAVGNVKKVLQKSIKMIKPWETLRWGLNYFPWRKIYPGMEMNGTWMLCVSYKIVANKDSNDVLAFYTIIAYYTVFASSWMECVMIRCSSSCPKKPTWRWISRIVSDPQKCNSCSRPLNRTMWTAGLSI